MTRPRYLTDQVQFRDIQLRREPEHDNRGLARRWRAYKVRVDAITPEGRRHKYEYNMFARDKHDALALVRQDVQMLRLRGVPHD